MGRFGSMVQIGTTEQVEKPRYASLQVGQTLESITLEQALDLFKLPKALGEYNGDAVSVGIGKFGPYVRYGKSYVSIPKDRDPLDVNLDEAIALIQAKAEAEEKSLLKVFTEEHGLEVRDGRFGPYIKYQNANYKLPKGTDIASLTYEDAKKIIDEAPQKKTVKRTSSRTKAKAKS